LGQLQPFLAVFPHRNALANLHILDQSDSFLAQVGVIGIGIGIKKFVFINLTIVCKINTKVRKIPSRRRSRTNFSLLQLYAHKNAWANFHILSQPNTLLAEGRGDHVNNESWLRVGVLLPSGPPRGG
jgi:hypothetical protein